MNIKKMILYILQWFIPGGTVVYIVAAETISFGVYLFWGYPINIPAYILSCLAAAVIYYPLNKYVFKNKCEPITITINQQVLTVFPNDKIEVYANPWGDYDVSMEREEE